MIRGIIASKPSHRCRVDPSLSEALSLAGARACIREEEASAVRVPSRIIE